MPNRKKREICIYEKTIKFYSLHLKTGNQGFLATENSILEKNYEIEGGRYLTSWPP